MNSKKIDVSKASLISLKAELSRKQDEVNKAKVQGSYIQPVPKPKKKTVWSKKNAGVTEREERDLEQQKEDEDVLKKSRAVLEAKSKLYDELSQKSSGDNSSFLVDFQQKAAEKQKDDDDEKQHASDEYSSPSDSDEDWVDYVDCLGRTRRCLKKDLAYIKEKDSDLSRSLGVAEEKQENKEDDDKAIESNMEPELVSANMKREMMRQKWEQQEELLRKKADIHYQDVLFDEARNHGVGYYGFSQDEAVRKSQQEALNKLRQQTQKVQEATKDARERRRQQMETRLKAARRRKRERMGLPPEEEKEEPEVKEETEEKEESIPVEEEKPEPKPEIKKPPKVRPWDIGKEGVKEPMSQEDWVKKKRDERPAEFAPPSLYQPDFIPTPEQQVKPKPTLFFSSKKTSTSQRSEGPFQKIRRLTSSSSSMHSDRGGISLHDDIDYSEEPSCSDTQKIEDVRGKGTEIPPPPTFDYYGPSSTGVRKNVPKGKDLETSIDAGLKFLRQQSEQKQKMREKGLLDIV